MIIILACITQKYFTNSYSWWLRLRYFMFLTKKMTNFHRLLSVTMRSFRQLVQLILYVGIDYKELRKKLCIYTTFSIDII